MKTEYEQKLAICTEQIKNQTQKSKTKKFTNTILTDEVTQKKKEEVQKLSKETQNLIKKITVYKKPKT